ncbi:hypothetical protein [Fibrella arboris]|uniref:hypothetical protein n=1 Tax=Fibrella arboris TaxID=3242486 RepID=UPI0035209989
MGLELKTRFHDKSWYSVHKSIVAEKIRQLPSFIEEIANREFWLKASNSDNPWEYDVRVFMEDEGLFIESNITTDTLIKDIKYLFEQLHKLTPVELVDDDDEIFLL